MVEDWIKGRISNRSPQDFPCYIQLTRKEKRKGGLLQNFTFRFRIVRENCIMKSYREVRKSYCEF